MTDKIQFFKFPLLILLIIFSACAINSKNTDLVDKYLWLEEIESPEALNWVKKQNEKTLSTFQSHKSFSEKQNTSLKLLEAKDKIPYIELSTEKVYNFWQDNKNTRGLWRVTSLKEYQNKNPKWITLIDIDILAKSENKNWVFKGSTCLKPENRLCLISLSDGGKDAVTVREFDTKTKKFVNDGFNIPEAKTQVAWINENSILVATNFGPDSLTNSGYPRFLKVWERNTSLNKSSQILSAEKNNMLVTGTHFFNPEGNTILLTKHLDFFSNEYFLYENIKSIKKIQIPESSDILGVFKNYLIIQLKKAWKEKNLISGHLLAIKNEDATNLNPKVIPLFKPSSLSTILNVGITKEKIIVNTLENVEGRLVEINFKNGQFLEAENVKTPPGHTILDARDSSSEGYFFKNQNFIIPDTLYFKNGSQQYKVKSLPVKFPAQNLEVSQRWTKSKDGTAIPYFIVGKKNLALNGKNPTLLYGYGGFEVSLSPSYNAIVGNLWLKQGGIYVVANIRGGGEFGPEWHQAALKENRQKAYDDFISVGEDLIKNKITSPEKLAIQGGSNGGLLVGAVSMQRPDLFGAVICQVPLLDMLRYDQLLAGASWKAEYGDPNEGNIREHILKYSPYQNVKTDKKYPPIFIITSTKDDRVHPGHARKMMAKLLEYNHQDIYYYENTEGGHAASSNFKQKSFMNALVFSFLDKTIKK